jgi:hypothetical protein
VKPVTAVLIAISAVGMIGLPLGDPKFLPVAIGLEASFIALTILSVKKVKYVIIPNIAIACVIIAGNTLSPTHTDIMLTLTPIYNALILITGGYVLQGLLVITSIQAYKNVKRVTKEKVDYMD